MSAGGWGRGGVSDGDRAVKIAKTGSHRGILGMQLGDLTPIGYRWHVRTDRYRYDGTYLGRRTTSQALVAVCS